MVVDQFPVVHVSSAAAVTTSPLRSLVPLDVEHEDILPGQRCRRHSGRQTRRSWTRCCPGSVRLCRCRGSRPFLCRGEGDRRAMLPFVRKHPTILPSRRYGQWHDQVVPVRITGNGAACGSGRPQRVAPLRQR